MNKLANAHCDMAMPASVSRRRSDFSEFRERQRDGYRQVLDRRVLELLTSQATPSTTAPPAVLARCGVELAQLMRDAVLANIIVTAGSRARCAELLAAKRDAVEQKLLPEFTAPPAGRWNIPGSMTLAELREHQDYAAARDRMVEGLVVLTEQFVACGLLGRRIYDSAAPSSHGAYSFILRHVEEQESRQSSFRQTARDPQAPFGQRRTWEHSVHSRHRQVHSTVERVHFLEGMSLLSFENYAKKLPLWARRLKTTIPEWMKPELQVVEGTIVREEISVLDEYTRAWETKTVTVSKSSPAIVLADLVLAGWSNEDLDVEFSWSWAALGGVGLVGLLGLVCAVALIPGAGSVLARGGLAASKWFGRAATLG
jgi:hypothetical protein